MTLSTTWALKRSPDRVWCFRSRRARAATLVGGAIQPDRDPVASRPHPEAMSRRAATIPGRLPVPRSRKVSRKCLLGCLCSCRLPGRVAIQRLPHGVPRKRSESHESSVAWWHRVLHRRHHQRCDQRRRAPGARAPALPRYPSVTSTSTTSETLLKRFAVAARRGVHALTTCRDRSSLERRRRRGLTSHR